MKVKELLANPERWTKGAPARNSDGYERYASASDAVCWCLIGAINKCYSYNEVDQVLNKVRIELDDFITEFNDAEETTHADILELVNELDI